MPVKLSIDESASEAALKHADRSAAKFEPSTANSIYTCPMHPEVEQDHPGNCPKCGMTLELKTVTAGADDEENAELRDMTRRFWIGAALALPVFILAMAHLIPALGRQPGWMATPRAGCNLRSPRPWSGGQAGRYCTAAGAPS